MPGIADAIGVFVGEGTVATDDVALFVPALVVTAVLGGGVPTGARPVAAIEIRLSVSVFGIGSEEPGCGEDAVAGVVTASFEAPAMGNWAGRLVSFR